MAEHAVLAVGTVTSVTRDTCVALCVNSDCALRNLILKNLPYGNHVFIAKIVNRLSIHAWETRPTECGMLQ